MKTAITIVQSIVLANFEKDATFDIKKTDVQFWHSFTNDFVRFDQDSKPVEAHIERLGLTNAQKIIDKLPHLHTQLLKELAECYVLGQTMPETNELLNSKNPIFSKEVQFLQTMQQAIKSVERKRIKTALPTAYDRLTFELSDTDLANAIKKKGREDLKNKFKQWDAELAQETTPIATTLTQDKKETKIISLSWVRYAAAACIVLATGIFYFKNTKPAVVPIENTVVVTNVPKDSLQSQPKPVVKNAVALAKLEIGSNKITVQESESMGFSGTKKLEIIVSFQDASQRKLSLEKQIALSSKSKEIAILKNLQKELAYLQKTANNYVFDNNKLSLFTKFIPKKDAVLVTNDHKYYLKKGADYYYLKTTQTALPLQKVTDTVIIETLEKINFENE